MNWSDLKKAVGKAAPMLGTLIGGPAGGLVGGMVSSALGTENNPDAVYAELQKNPEAFIKLKEIEAAQRVKLESLTFDYAKSELDAQVKNAGDVNTTMIAEGKSERWPQWSWRPFIGYAFGVNLLIATVTVAAVYVAAMLGAPGAAAALATLPAMIGALGAVNGTAVPILGIASFFRGKQKANEAASKEEA